MPGSEPKDNPTTEDSADRGVLPRRGVYPGSFNPPTVGHVAIVEAAIEWHHLDILNLVLSKRAINKETVHRPTLDHRIEVLEASVSHLEGVHVRVTELRLIADIASGYDVVVMGADKWAQVNDERFYENAYARDAALRRLPTVAIAARGNHSVPDGALLRVTRRLDEISSSAARAGDRSVMTPAALEFDEKSGAWTEPGRYDAYLRRCRSG